MLEGDGVDHLDLRLGGLPSARRDVDARRLERAGGRRRAKKRERRERARGGHGVDGPAGAAVAGADADEGVATLVTCSRVEKCVCDRSLEASTRLRERESFAAVGLFKAGLWDVGGTRRRLGLIATTGLTGIGALLVDRIKGERR